MTEDGRAARYSDLFGAGGVHEHPSECALCPICSGIALLRNMNPEVVEHLSAAARELVIAAGLLVAELDKRVAAPTKQEESKKQSGVRRIDIA